VTIKFSPGIFRGAFKGFSMTKSRAQKARRRQGLSVPYARQIPGSSRGRGALTNWVVGSQALTSTGQVIGGVTSPTSVPTWNPSGTLTTYNLVSASPITFQPVVIQPAVSGNIPTVGRVRIDQLIGKMLFSTAATTMICSVAVGIYVSEFTTSTSAWDVSDPLNPADAARDQWFFLEAMNLNVVVTASMTAWSCLEMPLRLSESVVIGGGQALNVTVSMVTSATTTGGQLFANPAFRVLTGPVA